MRTAGGGVHDHLFHLLEVVLSPIAAERHLAGAHPAGAEAAGLRRPGLVLERDLGPLREDLRLQRG